MKNTDIVVFFNLVKDQFAYGGKKYAKSSKKEATDILFERHTHRWLVGTIDKYTFRYANLARERDLLKIATYMYILFLKRGFHVNSKGLGRVISTTVEIKNKNFNKFISCYEEVKTRDFSKVSRIKFVSDTMRKWSRKSFLSINRTEVMNVFVACFYEWVEKYSNVAEQNRDRDTWNEISKKLAIK